MSDKVVRKIVWLARELIDEILLVAGPTVIVKVLIGHPQLNAIQLYAQ